MKLLVLGASQGTGALAVKAALDCGHLVTAFARHPEKLALEHDHLVRASGDFHSQPSIATIVPGHDAVIITASSTSLKGFRDNPTYFSQGTAYTIEAMKANAVKRLVVLSAFGVGDSRRLANFFIDRLVPTPANTSACASTEPDLNASSSPPTPSHDSRGRHGRHARCRPD
jgi:putative NADH-flavin reductase